ncbi:phytoene desaturase family protein [Hyalangium minutum]|uniref:Phytoene desaturase, neurosporene or lycopene producing n=1 Tax=Hyalangium minutum TaxID=394096 RepID=A0A085WNP9_9BACT|nr:phytoene desaturase family protein [Hyalangium minutum]KFE69312.1 Phytoene desaturase, neurosporene or lycopene producing [Hyalangium minutum]
MDVLIVGAGPGGLLSAINLAGLGLKVTVVEKDPVPGGRMKGLTLGEQNEYTIDTGPTIFQVPEILFKTFERAGKRLEDYVTLLPVEPMSRTWFWDGTYMDSFRDTERMAADLARFGPDKPAALKRWVADAEEKYRFIYGKFVATPADSLPGYIVPWLWGPNLRFKPWQTLYSHFNDYFKDDRITYGFAFSSKYLGLHPTTATSLFSIVPYLELAFGVWHPKGGFRAMAQGMMKCAQDLGVEFRMGTPVSRIWVEEGKARGVELSSGERLKADTVVVNADLPYAAKNLLDARWRKGRMTDGFLDKARYSPSLFMLYLGLDRVYDVPHHQISFSANGLKNDLAKLEDTTVDTEDPPFYVCNPCVTDPSVAPPGHSTLYVTIPTPHTGHPVDFKQAERILNERVPELLTKVGIHDITKHIRARRSWTAETWRDDFNVFRGAVFNLAHTMDQLGPLRPRVKNTEVSGLYFVGGGTHPGSGLLAIMESANIAADYISRDAGKGPLKSWPYVPPVQHAPAAK